MKALLIVEDNEQIAYLLEVLTKDVGLEVIGKEEDADSAFRVVKSARPDIAVIDIMLAGEKTGIELVEEIKKFDPNIKVLVITAFDLQKISEEVIKRGCDAILKKPFSREEFKRIIKEFMK